MEYLKGHICDTDPARGVVRVSFTEKGGSLSDWLPLSAAECNMPDIGDFVGSVVNSDGSGMCLGKIFSNAQPPETTSGGYYKKVGAAEFSADDKELVIKFGGAYIKLSGGNVIIRGKNVSISEDQI